MNEAERAWLRSHTLTCRAKEESDKFLEPLRVSGLKRKEQNKYWCLYEYETVKDKQDPIYREERCQKFLYG